MGTILWQRSDKSRGSLTRLAHHPNPRTIQNNLICSKPANGPHPILGCESPGHLCHLWIYFVDKYTRFYNGRSSWTGPSHQFVIMNSGRKIIPNVYMPRNSGFFHPRYGYQQPCRELLLLISCRSRHKGWCARKRINNKTVYFHMCAFRLPVAAKVQPVGYWDFWQPVASDLACCQLVTLSVSHSASLTLHEAHGSLSLFHRDSFALLTLLNPDPHPSAFMFRRTVFQLYGIRAFELWSWMLWGYILSGA